MHVLDKGCSLVLFWKDSFFHSLKGGAFAHTTCVGSRKLKKKLVAEEKSQKCVVWGRLSFAGSLRLFIFTLLSVGTGGASLFTALTETVSVKVNK